MSHVKHLTKGHWIPEQKTMVQSLYSCGANSIWEYSLLNPSGGGMGMGGGGMGGSKGDPSSKQSSSKRRKPSSSDPLHPAKSDFIGSKYSQLQFVYRPGKDEPPVLESDLSRQLHSSVRTPNLETSLRLISQGADSNYFHPEKNSTPLQVKYRKKPLNRNTNRLLKLRDKASVQETGIFVTLNATIWASIGRCPSRPGLPG